MVGIDFKHTLGAVMCQKKWFKCGVQRDERHACVRSLPWGRWSIARGAASRVAASGTPGRAPKTDRHPEMDAIAGGGGGGRAEARPQPPPPTTTAVPGPQDCICRRAPVARRFRRPCGGSYRFLPAPRGFRALTRPPPLAMVQRPLAGGFLRQACRASFRGSLLFHTLPACLHYDGRAIA